MSGHALDLREATVRYRHNIGLSAATLTVEPGEIHAIVGLNGAGKSTLMRAALAMLPLASGDVRVFAQPVSGSVDWSAVGHFVGSALAYPELSVDATLRVAADLAGYDGRAVDAIVNEFDLVVVRHRRVAALSSGNRQRTGIAAALLGDPRLVILDEPTTALDPAAIITLRTRLRHRADAGAAVLVSSHHLDEVARIADRITVIHRGRVVGSLDPASSALERAFFTLVARLDGVEA